MSGADLDPHGDLHGDVSVDRLALAEELAGTAADGTTAVASTDAAEYALRLGDDALVLAQQLGMWIARAPELEEDVALGNIALDLIGHARSLLHYAGTASGRSEDDLAYWRGESEFRNAWLFEQPNGDFAHTIARQLVASAYLYELYSRLVDSTDPTLAAIAAKSVKEVDYHRDHATQWVLRLAGGTEESRRRMLVAIADTWPYADELFIDDALVERLAATGVAVLPSTRRPAFD
ncbi:MAG: 1,2-phenylacetyl-CoA epoxidase subunit PaaC, partial [Agromyces sp.]